MSKVLQKIKDRFQGEKSLAFISLKKYEQLYTLLKDMIIANELPPEVLLPPTRNISERLNLSRSTVLRAYELLKIDQLILSTKGSGYRVLRPADQLPNPKPKDGIKTLYPELSILGKSYLNNINLINSTEDKSIAFRPGLPPLDIFPVTLWKQLSNIYWRGINLSGLSYSSTSGIPMLKQNIAQYLNLSRGIHCEPEQVIIVSGSLQSLYLISTVFLNPGDGVIVEDPTFPNVHSIFRSAMANLSGVPIDNEGLDINKIPINNDFNYKLMHITPSHHYPTSTRMSLKRRKDILDWANREGCIVIENDYEHELNNTNSKIPSLFTLDKNERCIYLGTFNRILHPSLRIGYMVVPTPLKDPIEALMRHSHRFVAPSIQIVLNQFIEKGHFYKHLQNLVGVVKERSEIFSKEFEKAFGQQLKIQKSNSLGLQVLAKLTNESKDKDLVSKLSERNIISHSYSKCFVSPNQEQGLILGHSSVPVPVIKQRIKQMAKVL